MSLPAFHESMWGTSDRDAAKPSRGSPPGLQACRPPGWGFGLRRIVPKSEGGRASSPGLPGVTKSHRLLLAEPQHLLARITTSIDFHHPQFPVCRGRRVRRYLIAPSNSSIELTRPPCQVEIGVTKLYSDTIDRARGWLVCGRIYSKLYHRCGLPQTVRSMRPMVDSGKAGLAHLLGFP